jgi:CBS domain-containing protein
MRAPVSIDASATVKQAAQLMRSKGTSAIIVNKGGKHGLLTSSDILGRVVADGRDPLKTKVEDVMTEKFWMLPAEADVETAAEFMREKDIRHLPLTDEEGEIVGMISVRDISHNVSFYLARHLHEEDFERPHYYEERISSKK